MNFDLTTFIIDSVNFLVLLWLLQRFVYRPLKRGIEARKAVADREAERVRAEALRLSALQSELATEQQAVAALRERVLRDATEQAEEQRARLLEQAKQDAETERARGAIALAAERENAAIWLRDMAIERGIEVAGSMLLQLAGDSLSDSCVARLLHQLETAEPALRPTAERPGDAPLAVQLSSAAPMAPETRSLVHSKLQALLKRPVVLEEREDARLLAGAVLEVGDQRFDASLAGQLELVRQHARAALEKEAAVA